MRLVFWGVVLVALGYAAWAGMMSAWSYFEVSGVVDDVLEARSLDEHRALDEIKQAIVQKSGEAGVPLGDQDVDVTEADRLIRVNVAWTFPVIVVRGDAVLAVPLSLKRTRPQGGWVPPR